MQLLFLIAILLLLIKMYSSTSFMFLMCSLLAVGTAFVPSKGASFLSRTAAVDYGVESKIFMSEEFVPETEEATQARIQKLVDDNPVLLFMKGSKIFPQCGFSNTACQILNAYGIDFHTVGKLVGRVDT